MEPQIKRESKFKQYLDDSDDSVLMGTSGLEVITDIKFLSQK